MDCNFLYVGQTKRDLKSRINEHKRAIKFQRPEQSALCEHLINLDHRIDWEGAVVLRQEKDYWKRIFTES